MSMRPWPSRPRRHRLGPRRASRRRRRSPTAARLSPLRSTTTVSSLWPSGRYSGRSRGGDAMRELLALVLVCALAVCARAADQVPSPAGQDKTPYPTDGWAEFSAGDPLPVALEAVIARAFEGER